MTLTNRIDASSRSRLERLRLLLFKSRCDRLLVTHLPNIQYLCGFTGSAGILLLEPTSATLFTDSRYTFQAREEVQGRGVRVQIASQGLLRAAGERLRAHKGRTSKVGFAPAQISVAQKQAIEAAAGKRIRWAQAGGLIERLRAVKDMSEIQGMRAAARLISRVFRETIPKISLGMTELDLAAEIDYAMRKLGSSGPSFETIVASGPRSAWAHARPTSKPLRKNELVVLDQGAILRGCCSDMTRTVFLGRAPQRIRKMYHAVLEAQRVAKASIRPGITAAEVDRAARQVLKKSGFGAYFTHSTGHGLGIEVHEMPRLGKGDDTALEAGMVVTVEPGVYIEGLGGVRIEDDVLVTSNGAEDLTDAPRDFLEL